MLSGLPWRDTSIMPKIAGNVDARVSAFFLIWGLHMSFPTFYVAVGGTVFFTILIYLGQSPVSLWRWVAQRITGSRMHAGITDSQIVRSMRY